MNSSLIDEIKQTQSEIPSCRALPPFDYGKLGVLVDNLQLAVLRLINEEQTRNCNNDQVIHNVIHNQLLLINVPENKTVESDCEESNYEDYKEFAEHCLQNVIQLFAVIIEKEIYSIPNDQLRKEIVLGLNIYASHETLYSWTNSNINRLSSELLKKLLVVCKCSSIKELFEGSDKNRFELGLAKDLLSYLLPRWKADTWKKNPENKYVFEWCLFNIKFPNLFEYITQVMPPSLLLADDLILDNKILGVRCLNHIISNVNRSELRMYGRAEVIFDALNHLLYTPEAKLMSHLLPCFIFILKVVDEEPNKQIQDMKRNKCDKVFSAILYNMTAEHKINLRRAYSEHLSSFISYMKIRVVRHMKPLLSVLSDYLDVCDSPEQIARKNSLSALKSLIDEARPRIPAHMESIFRSLFKCAYDIDTEFSRTPITVKDELKRDIVDCLILLRHTSNENFETLLTSLKETEIQPIQSIIQRVQ